MDSYRYWQDLLLKEILRKHPNIPLKVIEAFKKVPRHCFTPYFSQDYREWLTNLPIHYPLIYNDTTLLLHEKGEYISTISQPSLVLLMLELLDLRPGMKVFELGGGSGWNAALMGEVVTSSGQIISYEIIPEMAQIANDNLRSLNIKNVKVICGDGIKGFAANAPFERVIFTAGATDFPACFLTGLNDGGKLLFVLSTPSGDLLMAFKKNGNHLELFDKVHCRFVKVTGGAVPGFNQSYTELYSTNKSIHVYAKNTHPDQFSKKVEGSEVDFYVL